ncbi:hypothetical protein AAVH_35128 [Aphelenchoides avenae]|nr:hypothetical protein AAVH_35128 [Aphelenchus avenae]
MQIGAYDGEVGYYPIACNTTVPPLLLTFNGEQYEIPPSELVRPSFSATKRECVLNVFGDSAMDNYFTIGTGLARKYCLIFDHDNLQLGFASNRYSP